VIACIEILEQFNKTDIYLALYSILVEQELRICKKLKILPLAYIYPAAPKDVFFLAFK